MKPEARDYGLRIQLGGWGRISFCDMVAIFCPHPWTILFISALVHFHSSTKKEKEKTGVVARAFDPSTQEGEAGGAPGVQTSLST